MNAIIFEVFLVVDAILFGMVLFDLGALLFPGRTSGTSHARLFRRISSAPLRSRPGPRAGVKHKAVKRAVLQNSQKMKASKFTITLIIGVASLSYESPAATPQYNSSHSATFAHKHHPAQAHRPSIESQPEVRGVIPRTVRGGNPLQMLNPFAPRKYGTSEENVVLDADVPGKWDGIKLLSISF